MDFVFFVAKIAICRIYKPSFANERSRVRLRVNGSCKRKLFLLFPNNKTKPDEAY